MKTELALKERFALAQSWLEAAANKTTGRAWQTLNERRTEPELARLKKRLEQWRAGRPVRQFQRGDLLLLLLAAPGKSHSAGEGIAGVTRLLKLLFIAQHELGADALTPAPYAFVPYRFGPFCSAVYDDLSVLVRAGLVRRVELDDEGEVQRTDDLDEGLPGNGSNVVYRLTRRGREFARALAGPAEKKCRNLLAGLGIVKARLAPLPLRELLRYVYSRWPEYTVESEILARVLGAPAENEPTAEPVGPAVGKKPSD